MRNIEVQVLDKMIVVDLDKIPIGTLIHMSDLHQQGQSEMAGRILITLIYDSVGAEQLNDFSIVTYPFLVENWKQAVLDYLLHPYSIMSEIDEIVNRVGRNGG